MLRRKIADVNRLEVINFSILVERSVSQTLSSLLDIELKTSKTLGNKSSSFSFKQKLDLLTDIKAIEKSSVKKFQVFAEIRNQFAHNYDVQDFSTCFEFLDGVESFLRKNYSNENLLRLSIEEQRKGLYIALFNDILEQTETLYKKVEEKFYNEGFQEGKLEGQAIFTNILKKHASQDAVFNSRMKEIISEFKESVNQKI